MIGIGPSILHGAGAGEPPTPSVPAIVSAALSATPVVGVPLGVILSTTGYPPPITYVYAWRLNGTPNGATDPTYTPVVGDIGGSLRCRVTPSNSEGTGSSVTTDPDTVEGAPGVIYGDFSNDFSSDFNIDSADWGLVLAGTNQITVTAMPSVTAPVATAGTNLIELTG